MKNLGFKQPNPRKHLELNTIEQVAETFAFYFDQGIATELFVDNKTVFDRLVEAAKMMENE